MKIKYNLEMNDVYVFQKYFYENNSVSKLMRKRVAILIFCLILAAGIVISIIESSFLPAAIFFFMAFIGVFLSDKMNWIIQKRYLEKFYKSDENKGLLCMHELEICEDNLIERTEVNEQKNNFGGIAEILKTDDYGYIFIGNMAAHIIPKDKVTGGDFNSFMDTLIEKWKVSKS